MVYTATITPSNYYPPGGSTITFSGVFGGDSNNWCSLVYLVRNGTYNALWDVSNASTSTSQALPVGIVAGNETWAYTCYDGNGIEHASGTVVVNVGGSPPPTASFTESPSSGVAPLSVTFTDTSSGSPTSWSWSFGDGGTSTLQNPTHTYNTAGTYPVSLTVSNTGGSSSASNSVSVTAPPAPVASFTASPTSGSKPLTVNFTNTSTGNITSTSWTFGDGGTSTATSPSHTYTANGSFAAILTETGPGGSTSAHVSIGVGPHMTFDPGSGLQAGVNHIGGVVNQGKGFWLLLTAIFLGIYFVLIAKLKEALRSMGYSGGFLGKTPRGGSGGRRGGGGGGRRGGGGSSGGRKYGAAYNKAYGNPYRERQQAAMKASIASYKNRNGGGGTHC